MRWGTTIVDHNRSYPDAQLAVRADDADLLRGATQELEAHLLHEQARRLADVRTLLADLYQRERVAVEDAMLDAQAEQLAAQERGERFLQELATRLYPSAELLALARQLDDHALEVWREAAASLVEVCPPSLLQLRWRVEEQQRAELRSHAHLVRAEAHFGVQRRRLGVIGWVCDRGRVAGLRDELADCRRRRERSGRRLAHLDAQLQVIDRAEHARSAWIAHAREVLVRGLAATQVLADRQQQIEQQHDGGRREGVVLPVVVVRSGPVRLGAGP